jgi:probable HAF family extracellular repeat protein
VHVDGLPRAVLWDEGTITELGTLPGHDRAQARGISNAGHVVGTSTAGRFFEEGTGFMWHEGRMTELPPLPDDHSSEAFFVNSSGVAIGESRNHSDDIGTYVRWDDGEAVEIDPWFIPELFTLEGITDEGEVVFEGDLTGAFIWHDGDITLLPPPDEEADQTGARAASPGGLILTTFSFPCCSSLEYAIWDGTGFIRFDPPSSMDCWAIGDGGGGYCVGDGRHVVGKVPLDSPEGIAGVLAFFDEAVSNGTLEGAGPGNSGAQRIRALRNMLDEAGSLLEQRGPGAACGALNQVLRRTDGSPRPPDFVQGPAAPQLADRVRAVVIDLGC